MKFIDTLVQFANKLDSLGLIKEANEIDRLIIKMSGYSGGIIGIFVPKSVKDKLKGFKLENSVDAEDFHVSLIYLGEAKDIDEKKKKKIISACEKVCKKYEPFKARISGFGKFINKDERVIYASVDAVPLNELRADLYKEMEKILELDSEHGFTPHLTLAYPESSDEELPDKEKLPTWKVSKITVAFGDEHVPISLGDE